MTIDQERGPEFDRLYRALHAATTPPTNLSLTSMARYLFDEGVRVTPLLPETVRPTLVDVPTRIQLSRKRGWRLPAGAISCARPHRYGNPFIIGTPENGGNITREQSVSMFREALFDGRLQFTVAEVRRELRGRTLGCWCGLDEPCHCDVLLEVANA
ncbi:DUF4326 domain-containing protein [Microbacterium sp. NPDC058021]|uniref:DUF4326 domain-containing protein n=1 Tax=Microbacterium sp. NPDC058021 TaxID=3346306 RepID=UPI0036DB2EDE